MTRVHHRRIALAFACLLALVSAAPVGCPGWRTNTQELGVDEPDLVKSDGHYIYKLVGQSLAIVDAVPATALHEVGRAVLGSPPISMLQAGDRVLVFSPVSPSPPAFLPGTRLTVLDVADRTGPQVIREIDVEGDYVDARMYEGRVQLVTAVPAAGPAAPIVTLTALDLQSGEGPWSVSIEAEADKIYASTTALFVVSFQELQDETEIHRFRVWPPAGAPTYLAAGRVPGWVLDGFSMDEAGGSLRVATTTGTVVGGLQANHVFVLRKSFPTPDQLHVVGEIRDLAPGERIVAARYVGDRAFLATASLETAGSLVDPLFAIDMRVLSVKGELHVDGFSTYLHPLGTDHLLAVGNAADPNGQVLGLDLTIFDVSDLSNPTLAHRQTLSGAYSEALYEHKAFSYFPESDTLVLPVGEQATPGFAGAEVYGVDIAGGFASRGRIDHTDLAAQLGWPWPVEVSRSILIDNVVYTVSNIGIKANDALDPLIQYGAVGLLP
jgi:uncharacterized secreted protein with C-terminal beta-propeller domain